MVKCRCGHEKVLHQDLTGACKKCECQSFYDEMIERAEKLAGLDNTLCCGLKAHLKSIEKELFRFGGGEPQVMMHTKVLGYKSCHAIEISILVSGKDFPSQAWIEKRIRGDNK